MLRTAILSEIAVEAGLLDGDSGWVYVVQHQGDAPDLPFEKWVTATSGMPARDARTMMDLFAATTFRCSKCNRTSPGADLAGDKQLACPGCQGLALKRVRTPDVETVRQAADDWDDESRMYHQPVAEAEPVPLYPAEEAEAIAEPVAPARTVEVVPVVGKLGEQNTPRFESELRQLMQNGVRQIVLDLSRCDTVAAVGLTMLLGIARELRANNGQLVIAEVPERVRRVIEMFGHHDEFEMDHSTRGATRRLQAQDLAG